MEVVALSSGPLSAEVLPRLGGSLGSLAWRGEPVLRGWDGRTRDPNATAMYPLVPWSTGSRAAASATGAASTRSPRTAAASLFRSMATAGSRRGP